MHGSFLNYTHSPDCITDYPKRGHKKRRRRRRRRKMRSERAEGTSDSVAPTDAGSSAPSSHASASGSAPTLQLSPPTGAPGPTTVSGNVDAHPANLIDLHSPPSMPGENISGMMATMNITK